MSLYIATTKSYQKIEQILLVQNRQARRHETSSQNWQVHMAIPTCPPKVQNTLTWLREWQMNFWRTACCSPLLGSLFHSLRLHTKAEPAADGIKIPDHRESQVTP